MENHKALIRFLAWLLVADAPFPFLCFARIRPDFRGGGSAGGGEQWDDGRNVEYLCLAELFGFFIVAGDE
ncbi:unnamed protein product [Linum trigynum]|uniref:Secreted protein n=1 Tax=Linum trigynum TaxID=586398 RepID=A0AAV2GAF2_9ROSI